MECGECGSKYNHKQSLNRHIKEKHRKGFNINYKDIKFFKCSVCSRAYQKKKEILSHFSNIHDITISSNIQTFNSFADFKEWKKKYEVENTVKYVIMSGSETNIKRNGTIYYNCHRSGYFKSKGKGIRHLKLQGSKKIDGFCPSQMKVRIKGDEKCIVTLTPQHVGHRNELCHTFLTPSERSALAAKISSKKPFNAILEEVRNGLSTTEELQRLHLLTRKDLYNIEKSFDLASKSVRRSSDSTSVDTQVNEMRDGNDDCVLFYKPEGKKCEEYCNLVESDFALAIMNDGQALMLDKYGSGAVCIDGTHGLNAFDFELISLIIIDNMQEGFPCAFMFSNRTDEEILQIFFSKIKERVGSLSPNIFMSDMADSFFNAWVNVMGEPTQRLYCPWHVDCAWRKNLCRIKSKEKQTEVYNIIQSLMQERDEETFKLISEAAVIKLVDDPDTTDFGQYFTEIYMKTAKYWAYCYRLHCDLNTNMHIENMHKCIKHLYLQGKKKRLDKAIHALMTFLRDKMYDRIIVMRKEKVTSKLSELRKRHRTSLSLCKDLVTKEDNVWKIPSPNGSDINTVSMVKENCECQMICNECKSCIHMYTCTCIDSAIKFNMCKHIHLVCQLKAESVSKESERQQEELLTWINNDERNKEVVLLDHLSSNIDIRNDESNMLNNNRKLASKKKNILCHLDQIKKLVEKLQSIEEFEALERLLLPIQTMLQAIPANINKENFNQTKKSKRETLSLG
ncbi:uncharacterized protein [Centruroides vittatus]|uniref:uncharacterized protein n=1 Tax=Centruroides vittatus TaxID=120091 RepID=UPI00350F21EF